MADVGDRIVGSVILVLALLLSLGIAGVPFMLWIATILIVVVGILMLQGLLGANGTVAGILIIMGPAVLILPAFYPVLSVLLPGAAVAGLWIGGFTKLFGLW